MCLCVLRLEHVEDVDVKSLGVEVAKEGMNKQETIKRINQSRSAIAVLNATLWKQKN